MWSYVTSSVTSGLMRLTNHSVVNINNRYNLDFVTMKKMTDEQRKEYIEDMKIQVGMSYLEGLKMYIFKKSPNSELLKYFQ